MANYVEKLQRIVYERK